VLLAEPLVKEAIQLNLQCMDCFGRFGSRVCGSTSIKNDVLKSYMKLLQSIANDVAALHYYLT
jgi:hypothetical protein